MDFATDIILLLPGRGVEKYSVYRILPIKWVKKQKAANADIRTTNLADAEMIKAVSRRRILLWTDMLKCFKLWKLTAAL
jgi:hypothetical protein